MKRYLLLAILSFGTSFLTAQSTSKWADLFSYNNVLSIKDDGNRLIAATENGIFYYYQNTGEIKKLSKANGLHEVKITAFDYDSTRKIGVIGYQNGSIDVLTEEGIFLVVDIPIATGYNGDKKINHISISGDKATISAGYGVSIFDINRREFGDTAFFTSGSTYLTAKEATLLDNKVYVVTQNGVLFHELNTTFPIYSSWQNLATGSYGNIAASDIIVFSNNTQVKFGQPNNLSTLPSTFNNISDIILKDDKIIVTDDNNLYSFTKSGILEYSTNFPDKLRTGYKHGNEYFAGTFTNGILTQNHESIKPDGPYNNISSKIDIHDNQLVIASGGLDTYNNPIVSNLGYYHFDGIKWNYPIAFLNNSLNLNVLDAKFNPSTPTEIYLSNFVVNNFKGFYKFENNELKKHYTIDGPLQYTRPIGITFDESNNLIASINLFQGDLTTGYAYLNKNSDSFQYLPYFGNNNKRTVYPHAKNGLIYIPTARGGLLIVDYNNTPGNSQDDKYIVLDKNNNLPTDQVISTYVNQSDNVWIGTSEGLRVLSNPKSSITEQNPQTDPIVIEVNGIGEELFRDSEILAIAVDSGNQKWISTSGGGVFYISPNGEQTYLHFTKSNSPLPNDTVTDIKIDEKTGKVYFVTRDGVVSYQGDVANVSENFGDILVYPNPVVYSNFKQNVRIKGLAAKTNIRITDAAGNVVHSAVARGGYYEWNLNNHKGTRVASGVYFVLMTNEDGTDTATAKIAVVN